MTLNKIVREQEQLVGDIGLDWKPVRSVKAEFGIYLSLSTALLEIPDSIPLHALLKCP